MFDFTLICNQSYKVMKPDKNDSNSFSVLMTQYIWCSAVCSVVNRNLQSSRNHAIVYCYVQLCQNKPECGRQTLTELLIRPVQRLPSIMLLLRGMYAADTYCMLSCTAMLSMDR